MKIIFILAIMILPVTLFSQNYKNRTLVGEDSAKQIIKNNLSTGASKLPSDTLIRDKETAISVAEVLLFKSFGKAIINSERPYECYLIDGYWFLKGTLPKNTIGDVFEMIISATDGKVIKMTHGQAKQR